MFVLVKGDWDTQPLPTQHSIHEGSARSTMQLLTLSTSTKLMIRQTIDLLLSLKILELPDQA